MDFKIDKRPVAVGSSERQEIRLRAGQSETDKVSQDLSRDLVEEDRADLASFDKPVAATGDTLVVSNIKKALDVANNALDAIEETLTQRLYYAREAASLPYYTERHEELDAASYFNERLEGERVLAEAKANGATVIRNNQTYEVNLPEGEIRDAIGTGNIQLGEPAPRNRLYNSDASSSEEARLEQVFSVFRSQRAGYYAASAKADTLTPQDSKEVFTVRDDRPDALKSEAQARELANQIASQLGSAHSDEESKKKLIETSARKLDLGRVKALLS